MADIQTTSEGWYPGWRPDPTVQGTVEAPTTFIDKSGVFFREVWIAGVPVPVPVAVLAKKVRVFNPAIRYGAVSFGLVLYFLGCPLWVLFIFAFPILWVFLAKLTVEVTPREDWINDDRGFTPLGVRELKRQRLFMNVLPSEYAQDWYRRTHGGKLVHADREQQKGQAVTKAKAAVELASRRDNQPAEDAREYQERLAQRAAAPAIAAARKAERDAEWAKCRQQTEEKFRVLRADLAEKIAKQKSERNNP